MNHVKQANGSGARPLLGADLYLCKIHMLKL